MSNTRYISRRFPHNSDAIEFKAKYAGRADCIKHYCDGQYWVVEVWIRPERLNQMQSNVRPTRWWAWWDWLPW